MKKSENKQDEQQMGIAPIEQADVPITQDVSKIHLEGYLMTLKALQEEPKEILTNELANNSKYVPIGSVENKLDLIYSGLWMTENFNYKVVANEIIADLTLKVFIPGAGWISRIGCAAVIIQQKKGSELGDINAKIRNTLVKDFPHLKSECIKNAAKSLGNTFGRNLNRDSSGDYRVYISDSELLTAAKTEVSEQMNKKNVNIIGVEIFRKYEKDMNGIEKKKLQDFIRDTKIKIKEESNQKGATK